MTLDQALIPPWVPESVKSMAAAIKAEIKSPILNGLLHDARMKKVWKQVRLRAGTLEKKGALKSRLAALPSGRRMEDWGLPTLGVSLPDQACAALLCAVVLALHVARDSFTGVQVSKAAEVWHSAANCCLTAAHLPVEPDVDREQLHYCLGVAAAYLDKVGRFYSDLHAGSPYLLPRSSRKRNEDAVRGRVRALAQSMHAITGTFLYQTLATLASVALAKKVGTRSLRNWCRDLPG